MSQGTFFGQRQRPEPTPGHPIARGGLPWIYATWLAKLLGGDQCVRRVWFLSRFKHCKLPDRNAEQLAEWNREHNQMMRERRRLLEENGWDVQTEVDITMYGKSAIIAGKQDLVATQPGRILIVDGKTGKRRDADFYQVLIYLWARLHRPHVDPTERTKLAGEVFYKQGRSVDVRIADVDHHESALIQMVQVIATPTEPAPNPSRHECGRCTIRPEDCPKRYSEEHADERVHTEAF